MINTESGIQESKNLGSKLIKEDMFSSLVKAVTGKSRWD